MHRLQSKYIPRYLVQKSELDCTTKYGVHHQSLIINVGVRFLMLWFNAIASTFAVATSSSRRQRPGLHVFADLLVFLQYVRGHLRKYVAAQYQTHQIGWVVCQIQLWILEMMGYITLTNSSFWVEAVRIFYVEHRSFSLWMVSSTCRLPFWFEFWSSDVYIACCIQFWKPLQVLYL